ncbi:MAG TPA: WD40 repeat domain-containing protein, partial [Thermoanaerobaculia bacterium]|nr:WD40 repeat domain-containing protein [Thermoanaerobaculia bacterium]
QEDEVPSRVSIWHINKSTAPLKRLLAENSGAARTFTAHSGMQLIAVYEEGPAGQRYLRLFSMQNGNYIRGKNVPFAPQKYFHMGFSRNGRYIAMDTYEEDFREAKHLILSVSDLLPVDFAPKTGIRRLYSRSGLSYIWPSGQNSTTFWTFGNGFQKTLRGLNLQGARDVYLSPDGKQLATVRGTGDVEIWSTDAGRQIRKLKVKGRVKDLFFTFGDRALVISIEGGSQLIYDVSKRHTILGASDGLRGSSVVWYSSECQLLNIWDKEGRVLRYVRGTKLPFAPSPLTKDCRPAEG